MRPQSRSLSDQLLAILHDHRAPMTTAEIGQAAPPLMEIYPGCDARWHIRARTARTRQETCYGDHHVHIRGRFAREVYEALKEMAAAGEIIRQRPVQGPSIWWRPVSGPRFIAELEAWLALPAVTPDQERPAGAD